MAIKDRNILPTAAFAKDRMVVPLNPAVSLTSAVMHSYTPGFRFIITRVRCFVRTKAGAVSYVVKVGGRTAVATGTVTAATEVGATLSATRANLIGSATEAITVEVTTDGSGAVTDGKIVIEFRAMPMIGEAAAGDT